MALPKGMSSAFQQGSPDWTQCHTGTVLSLLLALASLPCALLYDADMALSFLVADLSGISCGGSLKLLNKVLLQEEQRKD